MKALFQSHSILLDTLRGTASQVVLVGHILSLFSKKYHDIHLYIQDFAILVFFFISGFLIFHTTLLKVNKGKYRFSEFIFARFARIYSVLVPSLLFVFLVDSLTANEMYEFHETLSISNFITSLLLVNSYGSFFDGSEQIFLAFGTLRPIWTLSIEWIIYISFGVGASIVLRRSEKFNPAFIILFIFSAMVPFVHVFSTKLTLVWLSGGLVYLAFYRFEIYFSERFSYLVLLTLIPISTVFWLMFGLFSFVYVMLFIALMFAFFSLVVKINFSEQFTKVSKFFASFSFSLYLTHYTLLHVLKDWFGVDDLFIAFTIGFVASNLFAFYFSLLFEKRFFSWVKSSKLMFNN